jgi:O-methyltransferase involved in polyketide biosynthesis
MKDISATALVTLKCHAIDALSPDPILKDSGSIQIFDHIKNKLNISVLSDKPPKTLVTHIALRARQYDQVVRKFIEDFPDSSIINIACGFDHRFERVDNGRIRFFDLDLPDVISVKNEVFPPTDRYSCISGSVFDPEWMKKIPSGPKLVLAEGIFMYFEEQQIKDLFERLKNEFGHFRIFFEVFNSAWLSGWKGKAAQRKLQKELKFGTGAMFKSGIPDSDYIETWDPAYKLIGEWSYLDTNHSALGLMRFFRKFEYFRKVQWSVYYEIGELQIKK